MVLGGVLVFLLTLTATSLFLSAGLRHHGNNHWALRRLRPVGKAPEFVDPATANMLLVETAAGIYLIIRGIDNLVQSQPFVGIGPAFKEAWALIRRRNKA
jgi:hypothetical protein